MNPVAQETVGRLPYIKLLLVLVLCCLGLLVYSNTFLNSFHLDDFPQVVNNHVIRNCGDVSAIWHYFPTRFMAFFSFALNYRWGGSEVFGYHAVNLLIHLGSSVLVFWLAFLTFNALWPAFFAGAIFLVHPVQTEAVNYIFQRGVLLATFFYLASLTLYIKARLAQKEIRGSRRWILYYSAALASAVLAMISKEMAASLPLTVCLYEFFFLRDASKGWWKPAVMFFGIALLIPLLTIHSLNILQLPKAAQDYSGVSAWQYFLTELRVEVMYLRLFFIPVHQSIVYDYLPAKSIVEPPVLASALFLGMILWLGVMLKRSLPVLSFGIFWFFITLLPESSIIPINNFACEYRLYLPMVGFCFVLSGGLFYLSKGRAGRWAIGLLCALVVTYAFLAHQRDKVWANEFTLWDDAAHKAPRNSMAYLNRGAEYQRRGDFDHALADYNTIIKLGSVTAITLSNRGAIFRDKGFYDLALANFDLAVKISPTFVGTYVNRAKLYQMEMRPDLALDDLNKVITFAPDDANGYVIRGAFYAGKGDWDRAIADYDTALVLGPRSPEIYGRRAALYYIRKDYDKCWQDVHQIEALGSSIKSEYLQALQRASGRER